MPSASGTATETDMRRANATDLVNHSDKTFSELPVHLREYLQAPLSVAHVLISETIQPMRAGLVPQNYILASGTTFPQNTESHS